MTPAGRVEGMDVLACALGDRLGYYRTLDGVTLGPHELAARTGSSARYAREWLEQQAMSGFVVRVDGGYALAPGAAEVLARPGTSLWIAPFLRQFAAAAAQWTRVADGARTGRGLGWSEYGPDMFESQSDANAAPVLEHPADTWLRAALPGLHRRLEAGEPLRVADIGCGGAWASIAGVRRARPDGLALVADMKGAEEFVPDGDPVQRILYGYSLLVCLPDAMSGHPDHGTGTVMRPATMDRYAREAGFSAARPLDVDHDFWRFYELMP